jgi:hypothetical protein
MTEPEPKPTVVVVYPAYYPLFPFWWGWYTVYDRNVTDKNLHLVESVSSNSGKVMFFKHANRVIPIKDLPCGLYYDCTKKTYCESTPNKIRWLDIAEYDNGVKEMVESPIGTIHMDSPRDQTENKRFKVNATIGFHNEFDILQAQSGDINITNTKETEDQLTIAGYSRVFIDKHGQIPKTGSIEIIAKTSDQDLQIESNHTIRGQYSIQKMDSMGIIMVSNEQDEMALISLNENGGIDNLFIQLVSTRKPIMNDRMKVYTLVDKMKMRKLWQDHVLWTRMVAISAIQGLADLNAHLNRLMSNQREIGNLIGNHFGNSEAVADAVTMLLKEHIDIAVEIVAAVVRKEDISALKARWDDNGRRIAVALHGLNPDKWPTSVLEDALQKHLDQTIAEVASYKSGKYEESVVRVDEAVDHMLVVANLLSN